MNVHTDKKRPHGEDMANQTDESISLSFPGTDGVTREWQVIDSFRLRDREYIALLPLEAEGGGEINIHLFRLERLTQDGAEGVSIVSIASDMEYDEAREEFEGRIG
ncbi:MAG: DUF1292 domain-containing protein [Oscillospiraceae bacterium]|nr:DUF1292 domain-containing protein [Oscillospiraceae bacterium]